MNKQRKSSSVDESKFQLGWSIIGDSTSVQGVPGSKPNTEAYKLHGPLRKAPPPPQSHKPPLSPKPKLSLSPKSPLSPKLPLSPKPKLSSPQNVRHSMSDVSLQMKSPGSPKSQPSQNVRPSRPSIGDVSPLLLSQHSPTSPNVKGDIFPSKLRGTPVGAHDQQNLKLSPSVTEMVHALPSLQQYSPIFYPRNHSQKEEEEESGIYIVPNEPVKKTKPGQTNNKVQFRHGKSPLPPTPSNTDANSSSGEDLFVVIIFRNLATQNTESIL